MAPTRAPYQQIIFYREKNPWGAWVPQGPQAPPFLVTALHIGKFSMVLKIALVGYYVCKNNFFTKLI